MFFPSQNICWDCRNEIELSWLTVCMRLPCIPISVPSHKTKFYFLVPIHSTNPFHYTHRDICLPPSPPPPSRKTSEIGSKIAFGVGYKYSHLRNKEVTSEWRQKYVTGGKCTVFLGFEARLCCFVQMLRFRSEMLRKREDDVLRYIKGKKKKYLLSLKSTPTQYHVIHLYSCFNGRPIEPSWDQNFQSNFLVISSALTTSVRLIGRQKLLKTDKKCIAN